MIEGSETAEIINSTATEAPGNFPKFLEYFRRYELILDNGFRPLMTVKAGDIPAIYPTKEDPDSQIARSYAAASLITKLKQEKPESVIVWTTGALLNVSTTEEGSLSMKFTFDPQGITLFIKPQENKTDFNQSE